MYCTNCQGQSGITVVGVCGSCGGSTSRGSDQLCDKCSKNQRKCAACGKRIGGGKSGKLRPLGQ